MFAVGKTPTTQAFDEAMYAPTTPLTVATGGAATRAAQTGGQQTGVGTGETHHVIKRN